jgi:hypothetical protein
VVLPKTTGASSLEDKYAILFEDKLVIAKEDPDPANPNINIYPWAEQNLLLSELIFDCAAGLFPCSPLEYAVIHTGNLNQPLDAAAKAALAKDYFDGNLGDGLFDSIKDTDCVVFQ